jgi:hypothetical protein
VFFDHDLSSFPLLGQHAIAACEQCHTTTRYRDADVTCVSCHRDDDVHLARLGPRCETCHNPNAWRIWRFDHETQTSFPLRGAHAKQNCVSCHVKPVSGAIELAQSCDGCHTRDDVHSGAFGRDCARCHTETEWRDVKILQQ